MATQAEARQRAQDMLIREIIARQLGITVQQLTNLTPLGEKVWAITAEAEEKLGRLLPAGKVLTQSTDAAALISAFQDPG